VWEGGLFSILSKAAEKFPQKEALVWRHERYTYSQLLDLACKVSAFLASKGIGKGERVLLNLPNIPSFVFSYYGILGVGAVVVPANPALKIGEIAYIAENAEISTAITYPSNKASISKALPDTPVFTPEDILNTSPAGITPLSAQPDDLAAIIYTSGTTGKPKGAMLTHGNIYFDVEASQTWMKMAGETFLALLPLTHAFGATVCIHLAFYLNGKTVLLERFNGQEVVETLSKEHITIFPAVPAVFAALLRVQVPREGFPDLKFCIAGGALMPRKILEAFEAKFGVPIIEGDGPTECSPVTCCNPLDATKRKIGSVGPPLPGVEMAIVDENDRFLPPREVGEIVVKGPNVMKGYWKDEESTREVLKDGWFHTGDLGYMDEDGFFYIVDRKKDLIIVGGANVYPREVEEVLLIYPGIAECAVVGKSDPLRGEVPMAFIVPQEGADIDCDALIKFLKGHLANYKVPRQIRVVEELPKNVSGKVLKYILRRRLEEEDLDCRVSKPFDKGLQPC